MPRATWRSSSPSPCARRATGCGRGERIRALTPDSFPVSRRAQRAEIVPARGALGGAEFAAQPDLPRGRAHAAGAAIERDQRRESALARRQVDAAGVGTAQPVGAFQEDGALTGEEKDRRDAAYRSRWHRAGHDELVVALDTAPNA